MAMGKETEDLAELKNLSTTGGGVSQITKMLSVINRLKELIGCSWPNTCSGQSFYKAY